jgi:isocitrate dehydrogenase kinase/phosphatase
VDTILLDTKAVGRLFSLARDYFMVDMEVPSAYVAFLQTVVPSRSRSELYTLVGLQKQGKTLHFRDLVWHLRHSTDKFEIAPGVRGMVMLVFSLPSFPYVFKVIRDWFEPPKDADRKLVEERYKLVKHHDRAGRMADSLEYVDVSFPKDRFREDLLDEMRRIAPQSVEIGEDRVLVRHLYVERKLVPLDMAVADADDTKLAQVLGEYGDCIKDLAAANIFPGDLMLKNFGVTRFGRVLFYDYDEIAYVTSCRFRSMPKPRDDDDEMRAEPWFNVGPDDVFPEQFPTFLLPPGKPRQVFCEKHGELATASYWLEMKAAIESGRVEERSPYPDALRFAVRYGRGAR